MRKAQEVERCRFLLSTPFPVIDRKRTKFQKPRLLGRRVKTMNMNQRLWRVFVRVCVLAMAAAWATPAHAQMSEELAAQLSQNVDQHVIVIMKSQHAAAHKDSAELAQRSAAIDVDQAPLMDELRQVHATNIKNYHLVNALAATVSKAELERLKANPAVAAVVPDIAIHRRPRRQPDTASKSATSAKVKANANASSSLTPNIIPGACAPNGGVQLVPEGLALTYTDSDNPNAPTAHSLGITGTGVKVAWIADGVDPNNVNFIRPDGKSVFDPSIGGDYQDFSGDGPDALTGGGEAFLDSNTIAGQGIHVYNVQNYGVQPDPSACNIRIEGVAPGAALVGLRVLGTFEDTTTSNILEAIDYAVEVDHVNVIDESFSLVPDVPDITSLDVSQQFNDAAVAAGVVVSVSSGDAGSTNTIGSPSTDPLVFSVGASTQFQAYAQTNADAARYFATTGWLSNNISALSSGGFDEAGGTIDLVAPGDSSWTSCDASPNFTDCTNFFGQFSDVILLGGTSESSPFVAGAAALVIQAYRQTHAGASPTPALVKQILLSTAGDLGAPASEQGAGLLDSYQAVLLAESIPTSDGSPKPVGNTLLFSTNQLNAVGAPSTTESWSVTVTNTGASPQIVNLSGRTIGPDQNVQTGRVTLNDSTSPKFVNGAGLENNYAVFHFQVPPFAQRLDGSIAWPGNPIYCLQDFCEGGGNSLVRLIFIDPHGGFAADSFPAGPSNFGNVDVRFPVPGSWTGVIFGDVASVGGTNGTIPWHVETQQFAPFASVQPSSLVLPPGQSGTVTVAATTPSSPGDRAGSIVLTSDLGFGATSIPVTLRSLVDVASGGTFSGVLTGGNGGDLGEAQEQFYEFNVPPGVHDITANVSLTNDANDPVGAYLVSPDGDVLGYGQNLNLISGAPTLSLTAYTLNPVSGVWTMIVAFGEPVVGNEISQPFTGNIQFDHVRASVSGLPNSAGIKLSAGVAVPVSVTITNKGAAPQAFFVDPRLNATQALALPVFPLGPGASSTVTLPLTTPNYPTWVVPTQTSSLSVSQTSSLPAMFDFTTYIGDPDIASARLSLGSLCSTTATASYSPPGGTVTAGLWVAEPTECGPYPSVLVPPAAPAGSATIAMTAQTKGFDSTVTSTTGDLWLLSINPAYALFSPLTLNPGATGTITVTITPSGTSGTVVQGTLYVDDLASGLPTALYVTTTGDELAGFPYIYTIK
jgi:Subtilase family/Peptidase inhibitor I9